MSTTEEKTPKNETLKLEAKPRISALKRKLVALGLYPGQLKVASSSIAWIRYQRSEQTLDVAFHNGSAYRYFDVRSQDVAEFLAAPSIGRQFNKQLRNEFEYQLLRGRRKPAVAEQKKVAAVKADEKTLVGV